MLLLCKLLYANHAPAMRRLYNCCLATQGYAASGVSDSTSANACQARCNANDNSARRWAAKWDDEQVMADLMCCFAVLGPIEQLHHLLVDCCCWDLLRRCSHQPSAQPGCPGLGCFQWHGNQSHASRAWTANIHLRKQMCIMQQTSKFAEI